MKVTRRTGNDHSKYLFIVNYEDDAERKRIEYLLEKWQTSAKVSKLKGMSFIIETDEISKFVKELFSKLDPKSSVKSFKIIEKDFSSEIKLNRIILEYLTKESTEVVKKLLEYIFSKNNIRYYSSDGDSSKYFVLTRKGRIDVEVSITHKNSKTLVKLIILGYGDTPEYMAEKLKKDLSILEG